jgi:Ribbon-helix-helix protein, copG family
MRWRHFGRIDGEPGPWQLNVSGDGCHWIPPSGEEPSQAGPDRLRPGSDHMVYHMVMGRKEVLVQLDDDLIERLDRLAEKQGTSRSELLRRGAAAVLEAAEHAEADRALQDAYRRVPQDPAIVSAASRLAALTAPEW